MRFKKYIFLAFFLGLLPFACFLEAKYPYYSITNMNLETYRDIAQRDTISSTDTLGKDSVVIRVVFSTKVLAQLKGFSNECYAFRKAMDGHRGLKDKVVDIKLESDRAFNAWQPGENLTEMLLYKNSIGHFSDMHDLLAEMNSPPKPYRYSESAPVLYILLLTQRPIAAGRHNFTVRFEFRSGSTVSAQTSVTWK